MQEQVAASDGIPDGEVGGSDRAAVDRAGRDGQDRCGDALVAATRGSGDSRRQIGLGQQDAVGAAGDGVGEVSSGAVVGRCGAVDGDVEVGRRRWEGGALEPVEVLCGEVGAEWHGIRAGE